MKYYASEDIFHCVVGISYATTSLVVAKEPVSLFAIPLFCVSRLH
jgi:hypothetical protein